MEQTDQTFGRENAQILKPNVLQVGANKEYLDIDSDWHSPLERKHPVTILSYKILNLLPVNFRKSL